MVTVSFCGECGERLQPGGRFCGSCGAPRPQLDPPAPTAVDPAGPGVEGSRPDAGTAAQGGHPTPSSLDPVVATEQLPSGGGVSAEVDERTTLGRPRLLPPAEGLDVLLPSGRALTPAARVVLGRDPVGAGPDDVLVQTPATDLGISKTHLAFERDDGLWLVDLHSMNGVELETVHGVRRFLRPGERAQLSAGDRVYFGDQQVTVAALASGPHGQRAANPQPTVDAMPEAQANPVPTAAARADEAQAGLIDAVPLDPPPVRPEQGTDRCAVAPAARAPLDEGEPVPPSPVNRPQVVPVSSPTAAPPSGGWWWGSGAASQSARFAPADLMESTAGSFTRHRQVSVAMVALGALAWLMLVAQFSQWSGGVTLTGIAGSPEAMWLLASVGLAGYALAPARSGSVGGAVLRTAAAVVITWVVASLQLYGAVPMWVFWLCLPVSLALLALLVVQTSQVSPAGVGTQAAEAMLIVAAVLAAAFLVTLVVGSAVGGMPLITAGAVAGVSGWALWSLRHEQAAWVVPTVAVLLGAAAIGHWTSSLPSVVGGVAVAAAGVIVLSPALWEATPWSGLSRVVGPRSTPELGASPGTGPIARAWSDMVVWTRTAWVQMSLAGMLFWLILIVAFAIGLAVLMIPLVVLGVPTWSSDGSGNEPSGVMVGLALLWVLVGWQVALTAVSQALGLLSSQGLAQAMSEHPGGRPVSASSLVVRSVAVFWKQLPTAVLYTLGVLVGSMLCIIPGVYLQVRWAFALPMGEREQVRGRAALVASWRLTEGRAGVTFAVTLIGGLVWLGVLAVAGAISLGFSAVFGASPVAAVIPALVICLGVSCTAALIGSLLRQFLAVRS